MSLIVGEKQKLIQLLSADEVKTCIEVAKGNVDLYEYTELHDKLVQMYNDGGEFSNEMPYSVSTGDSLLPDVWLSDRLSKIFKEELDS
jgi:hypothetical protein